MAQIKPFRGIYYNSEKISDLSTIVCPPHDVISPQEQMKYHNLHSYNYIHILLGLSKSNDNRYDNRYTRARKYFEDWLKKGILVEDTKPCLYFYRHDYTVRGVKHSRVGFIGLMRLWEKENSKILPHEYTQSKAKEDRLRLWRHVKINCSPIFVCFSDREKKVEKILTGKVLPSKPFMDIVDPEHVRHTLWRLEEGILIDQVKDVLANQHLFIADGHHRYEVALELRRQLLSKKKKTSGQEPFHFIMTYFTNLDSKDLIIFPIHRVIKRLRSKLNFLEESFRVDKVTNKYDLQILLAKAGQNENALGLYMSDGMRLLRLKNKTLIDQYMHEGSREFRSLDTTILKYFILDRLRINHEEITYVRDFDEATRLVDRAQAEACFIMNPVKIEQLKNIALLGERMPPKTTYFYPKVLSGLTIYKLTS